MLYVAGEWVASLEDNGADGTLNGVAVFDSETRDMEYFYVSDGLDFVPASDEEMDTADKIGSDIEEFLGDALESGEITSSKVTWLRFKIWLRKWEISMASVAAGLAVVGFLIGRLTASKRSEQAQDSNPPPLCS